MNTKTPHRNSVDDTETNTDKLFNEGVELEEKFSRIINEVKNVLI